MQMTLTLRAARVNAGMTQEAAAKAMGVCRQTLIRWEAGKDAPRKENLEALCRLYGIKKEDIREKN